MAHVQKRLLSKVASSVSVHATAAKFPPKEALYSPNKPQRFEPETWAALQPPPPSALSSLSHRIGLAPLLNEELALQVCTHSSFIPFHEYHQPDAPKPVSNAQLAAVGNSLMGLFATEHVHATYPYLPTRVLKAAVTAHVGPLSCANVAQEMGAAHLLRWRRMPDTKTRQGVLQSDALATIPRSLVALIYQKRSILAARKFVQSYFLSREIDLKSMLKFRDPKTALLEMVTKLGREHPKSRLLKETGRFSNSPVFVVGIYSGADLLGEGFGTSLKMAEFRAAENALHRVYLTRTPSHLVQLPTSTFPAGEGDLMSLTASNGGEYVAPELTSPEIMYASSGRSFATVQ